MGDRKNPGGKRVAVRPIAGLKEQNPVAINSRRAFLTGYQDRRIRQVIATWPFTAAGPQWSVAEFLQHVKSLEVAGVELLDTIHWPQLQPLGLICAATKSHTFIRGMNNRNHHAECFAALEKAMEATARAGFGNVMTFTGLADTTAEKNGSIVSAEEGRRNCVEGYKKMAIIAEKLGVSMILEPLNSKVTENMKGHPGYQGDHLDYCLDIVREVSSPGLKLLFDVYHIQVMDGDIIRNLERCREYIGHVQIAGVPGRGEIGSGQEINYRRVMQALLDIGYEGYVGHEWIPTGNALDGLKEAIKICNI